MPGTAAGYRRGGALEGLTGAFWCHFPPDLRYGLGTVLAHLLWRRLSGGDFIKVMNEYAHPLPRHVSGAAELALVCTQPLDRDFYRGQLGVVHAVVTRSGGRHPVFATVLNPFGQMRDRYGWPRMAGWIAEDPAAVAAALRRMAADLAVLARDYVTEAGAAGVFFASQGGEAGQLDEAGFAAFVAEPDRLVLEAAAAAGSCTILHVCGQGLALPRYRNYPAAAVNWDATHNVVATELWPAAYRMPGLDLGGALRHGDATAIRAEVQALPRAANGGPPLLAAACTVSCDLPFWRMRAALAAAGGRVAVRPGRIDLLAWQALRTAARLRGAVRRRLALLRGQPAA
jgi:hypothetical protein